jgi:hypothetical protein
VPLFYDILTSALPIQYSRLATIPTLEDQSLMNANFSFLKDVTTLIGGLSSIDAIDTTRITVLYFAKARITLLDGSKQMQGWLARTRIAGEVESSGATPVEDFRFIVPDNFHITTNNVIWERVE